MANVHFVDTSILATLLQIPGRCQDCETVIKEYNSLKTADNTFVLPVAVLVETGNHIAHISDGQARRTIALKFMEIVNSAMQTSTNWNVVPNLEEPVLNKIISDFDQYAMKEIGFGDVSIVQQFEEYWRNKQPIGKIRIWSLDTHLAAYSHEGGLKRRKSK